MGDIAESTILETRLGFRLGAVQNRVADAANSVGRHPDDVTIVAVTKSVERDAIDAIYNLGVREIAENRVQDAADKLTPPIGADMSVHMIGQLQTNKVRRAIDLFSLFESVDRLSLIKELQLVAEMRSMIVPVLLQINIAGEVQKAGCATGEVNQMVEAILATSHLDLRGLMTIAPLAADPERIRPIFRNLFLCRESLRSRYSELSLPILSMGMTDDFPIAVQEGATHIRVGRAIFS